MDDQPGMKWTTEAPKVEGWYWVDCDEAPGCYQKSPVHVDRSGGRLVFHGWYLDTPHPRGWSFRWSDKPIEEPQ